jgi:hypothetical protein
MPLNSKGTFLLNDINSNKDPKANVSGILILPFINIKKLHIS